LVLSLAILAEAKNPYKEWAETIAHSKFLDSCWGEKTAMKHYLMVKKATEECMGLDPAFDLDLFPEEDNSNPFLVSQTGMATLPAQASFFRQPNLQQPQQFLSYNPMYQQQAAMLSNPWLMQLLMSNPANANLARGKRAVMPPTQEDLEDFAENIAEAKHMMHAKVGNLTCVLSKLDVLDANLNINLKHFTQDMWTMFERGEEPDMVFKEKMIESYEDCHTMANSLPLDILAKKGPGWKQFGRQKMFFKCEKKMAMALCVKKELVAWKKIMYGESTPEMRHNLGLPDDEYDASFMAWEIMKHNTPKEEEFVMDFIFGK